MATNGIVRNDWNILFSFLAIKPDILQCLRQNRILYIWILWECVIPCGWIWKLPPSMSVTVNFLHLPHFFTFRLMFNDGQRNDEWNHFRSFFDVFVQLLQNNLLHEFVLVGLCIRSEEDDANNDNQDQQHRSCWIHSSDVLRFPVFNLLSEWTNFRNAYASSCTTTPLDGFSILVEWDSDEVKNEMMTNENWTTYLIL